jgi:putative aldouronate transport system permease protein
MVLPYFRRENMSILHGKRSAGEIIFDDILVILAMAILVLSIFPFLYILNYSLSTSGQISHPLLLWPQGFTFKPYETLFKDISIIRAFGVSVSRAIIGSVCMLIVNGMAGYALSRPNLPWGKVFRLYFLFTMYFSGGIIPTYLLYKNLHLLNNYLVYILPVIVVPFNMFLIKTYIEAIPRDLEEAVLVDGGTEINAYFQVLLPLCMPVNAAVFLFSCINHWNAYIDNQLYNAMSNNLHTLQYVLFNTLATQTNKSLEEAKMMGIQNMVSSQSLKMAITVITIVPVMCVYPFLRKYFVSGLLVGSIKA